MDIEQARKLIRETKIDIELPANHDAHVRARRRLIEDARADLPYMSPEAYVRVVNGWPRAVEPWDRDPTTTRASRPPVGFFDKLRRLT